MTEALRVVPLGRLASLHHPLVEKRIQIKVDLFSPGGLIFKDAKDVFLSPDKGATWHGVQLVEDTLSLGGSWGQQKRVVLSLDPQNPHATQYLKTLESPTGSKQTPRSEWWVGMPRDHLLAMMGPQEFLAWDYLGVDVYDRLRGEVRGKVIAIWDPYPAPRPGSPRLVNLEVSLRESKSEKTLEFPSSWIVHHDFENRRVEVEDLSPWLDAENSEDSEGPEDS